MEMGSHNPLSFKAHDAVRAAVSCPWLLHSKSHAHPDPPSLAWSLLTVGQPQQDPSASLNNKRVSLPVWIPLLSNSQRAPSLGSHLTSQLLRKAFQATPSP